ncbi:MAG: helix-turn-helix transcriptional regulator [Ferruginibacter sp.]
MKYVNSNDQRILIGSNIRQWRMLKGIKQSQLADQLGITTAALSNIENDKTNMSMRRIEAIAVQLQLDVVKLFSNPLDLLMMTQ